MITQIKGRLVEKSPTELVVDCHGVGYSINISLNTYSQLNDEDSIKLFEEGIELKEYCEEKLKSAKLKIDKIVKRNKSLISTEFK